MGKFGIGARVSDDGDLGTIIDKRPGERLVKFDEPAFTTRWWKKGWLKAVAPAPEVSAPDTAVPTVAPTTASADCEFKVGDKVKFTTKSPASRAEYFDGVMTVAGLRTYSGKVMVKIGYPSGLNQITTPESLILAPTLTVEVGKFYKTRDGKRVGPIEETRGFFGGSHPFCYDEGEGRWSVTPTGVWSGDGKPGDWRDLVEEWAEPVEPAPKFKVGDLVKIIDANGGGELGDIAVVTSAKRFEPHDWLYGLENTDGSRHCGLFERRLALAPKFSIGDKVTVVGEIVEFDGDDLRVVFADGFDGYCAPSSLTLAA